MAKRTKGMPANQFNKVSEEEIIDQKVEEAEALEEERMKQAAKEKAEADKLAKAKKAEAEALKKAEITKIKDDFVKRAKQDIKKAKAFLDRADVAENQAADRRLSAAVTLAELEAGWKSNKIQGKFKDFCVDNGVVNSEIRGRSWENVRKLLAVGRADDPEAAMLALRDGTRKAVAKSKEKKEKELQEAKEAAQAVEIGPIPVRSNAPSAQDIMELINGASKEDVELVFESIMFEKNVYLSLDQMKEEFNNLAENDRYTFAEWVCNELNLTITI